MSIIHSSEKRRSVGGGDGKKNVAVGLEEREGGEERKANWCGQKGLGGAQP